MKRFVIFLISIVFILMIGLWFGSNLIAQKITQTIIEKSPVPITVVHSELSLLPFEYRMSTVDINYNGSNITIQKIQAAAQLLSLFRGQLPVVLTVNGANIVMASSETTKEPEVAEGGPSAGVPEAATLPVRVPFKVIVEQSSVTTAAANIRVDHMHLEGLDLEGPWTFNFSGGAKVALLEQDLPIAIDAQIERAGEQFKLASGAAKVSSVTAQINGTLNLQTKDWEAAITASNQDPVLPVLADIDLKASYQQGQITLSPSKIQLDATHSEVNFKEFLRKPKGTTLKLHAQLKTENNLVKIEPAQLQLGAISLQASAQVSQKNPMKEIAAINLNLSPVNLAGIQSMLPMAAQYPMSGTAELIANFQGLLSEPKEGALEIKKLNVKSFAVPLKMKAADEKTWSAEGSVKGDIDVVAKTKGTSVLSAQVRALLDSTGLEFAFKDMVQKSKNQLFVLNVQASSTDAKHLNLQRADLTTTAGILKVAGRMSLEPEMDLLVQTAGLDFVKLAQMLPVIKPYNLQGSIGTNLKVSGKWDSKGGMVTSPLQANGDINVNLVSYTHKSAPAEAPSAKPAGGKPGQPVVVEKPSPVVPEWPAIKRSTVNLNVKINELLFNDLLIKNFTSRLTADKGALTGSLSLKVFSGDVELPSIKTSLITPWPTTDLQSKFKSLNMKDAVNWASPDWKDQIQGLAHGTISAQVPFPKRPDFLDNVKAQGDLNINNGVFSSLKFQNMAKEKLSSIPGVGKQGNVKMEDLRANMDSQFVLSQKTMTFNRLHMITPDKDELTAKGRMGLDKSVDLEGTAALASAPVQGSIREANSDTQGRFVIPLRIKGYINKPELSFAQETVQQILSNSAAYELKKLQKSIPPKQVDDLKKKAEEGLKKLFGG